MNYPKAITLCEVGLRDGLQNEKTLIPTAEKLHMLRALIDAGFPVIEVGSFMHPKAVPQMADTDELFRELGVDVNLCVKAICDDHNVDEKTAREIFGHMWIYTYGIGVMCATGASEVSDEQVSEMLTEVFTGLMMYVKAKR